MRQEPLHGGLPYLRRGSRYAALRAQLKLVAGRLGPAERGEPGILRASRRHDKGLVRHELRWHAAELPVRALQVQGAWGEEPAVAKSEPKEKDDPKAHCKDTGCRDAAPSELAEAAAAINEAAQPENQRSRQQATQQQEAAQSQSQQQQASPQAQDEQTQSQPAQSQQAEGAPAKTKKGCDWATMDCRIFDEQGEAQPQAKQARLEQVQPKQPEQAQAQAQDQASQRPHAQINDGLEPGFFPLPDSDSQPKEESHVTTDLLRIRRPRSGRHRRRHGPRVQQQQAEGDSMNAFGEENQEMQAEEDAEYKQAQRYR